MSDRSLREYDRGNRDACDSHAQLRHDAEIRTFARSALAEIGATPDLDPVELCRRLSIHRDHPIEIVSTRMPCSSLLGFCVKTTTTDYIVHPHDLARSQHPSRDRPRPVQLPTSPSSDTFSGCYRGVTSSVWPVSHSA